MNKSIVCLFVALFSMAQMAISQEVWNPLLTGAPVLSITPDARAGSMGDLGAATAPDINSQYWNPSKYAFMESNAGLSVSYTPWLRKIVGDIDLAYVSGYYKFDELQAISGSFRYFSLGQIPLTDINGTNYATSQPYELAADVAYSRKLSDRFSMGVTFRFLYSDLNNGMGQTGTTGSSVNMVPGWSLAADIAGYYVTPITMSTGDANLSFGFNISNIGSKITYDEQNYNFIPTNLRLGLAFEMPFDDYNSLTISAEANKYMVPTIYSKFAEAGADGNYKMTAQEYSDISVMKGLFWSFADAPGGFKEEMQETNWAVGLEYAYNKQFFVRAGYYNEHEDKGNRKFFTVGAGFKLYMFQLDAGYVISVSQTNPLDQTLRFSLSFDMVGLKDLVRN